MEYIYSFIELINESRLFSFATLLFVILYLIRLYIKKEEDEKYIGLKIIGFYILGGFNFNFKMDWFVLALPIGFCIYYFAMNEKERPNPTIKYKAAVLGVIMMYVGVVNGMIYEKVEYRERTIKVEDARFENLEKDYALIKKKLGIDYSNISTMELEYDNDRKIKYLNYSLRDDKNIYSVFYEDNAYKVNVSPMDTNGFWNFGGLGSFYNAEELFKMMSKTKFNEYDSAISYRMRFNADGQYHENMEFYTIDYENYSIDELDKIWGVHDAVGIEYDVFLNPTEDRKEGFKNEMYLMNYGEIEYAKNYEEIEIESIKNNETVVISDQDVLRSIYKETKVEPYAWSPVTGINVTLEPNLYVKYSDGSVIGFCEEVQYARVDEDGVSIWYVVPSDLYTFMINKYFDASRQK